MGDNRFEMEIGGLIETAKPAPEVRVESRERVMSALGEAQPVRATRKRWVMAAVGTAVVLFALGFVPVPMGKAPGALSRALAAVESVDGVYVKRHYIWNGKHTISEEWQASGGLRRSCTWDSGELTQMQIDGADFMLFYQPSSAVIFDAPPVGHNKPLLGVDAKSILAIATLMKDRLHSPVSINEWREMSLWGGMVNNIEVDYAGRKTRYETDPETGRLISEREWLLTGDEWALISYTEKVDWDMDIPSDTFQINSIPNGTTVIYWHWWKGRCEQALVNGSTEDWQIAINHLDVKRNGDIVVVLARDFKHYNEGLTFNHATRVEVNAIDNQGVTYHQARGVGSVRDRWTTTLIRNRSNVPVGQAKSVTLVVRPNTDPEWKNQVLTFKALPLPAPSSDVEATKEVIQY
jgi:hypothetical protein